MKRLTNVIADVIIPIAYITIGVIIAIFGVVCVYHKPTINITNYEENLSTLLTEKEQKVFDEILTNLDDGKYEIIEHGLTKEEYQHVRDELRLYYGSLMLFSGTKYSERDIIFLDKEVQEAQLNKTIVDAHVKEALGNIYETDNHKIKLILISEYIARKMNYDINTSKNLMYTAVDGNGVCHHYAMLFYKMSRQLGYETYICFGEADGQYHAWNSVILKTDENPEGKEFFYDVTWYDSNSTFINELICPYYLYSETSWNREFEKLQSNRNKN